MKRSRSVVTVLSLFSVLVASSSRTAAQRTTTLTVFAAASLTEPFSRLGKSFEAAHPGTTVRFNFSGSQQLFLQIQQGAKADVLASADARWMQTAKDSGSVRQRSERDMSRGERIPRGTWGAYALMNERVTL